MKKLIYETNQLVKGLKLLFLFFCLSIITSLIIQSCNRYEYENSDSFKATEKFTSTVSSQKNKIGQILFNKINSSTSRLDDSNESIYLEFPEGTSNKALDMYTQTNSLQDLSNLIDKTNAVVQYDPTTSNSTYEINVPIEVIVNSLNPLIIEAKNYLYTKGFTKQDIQNMLVEENGKEEDLIPFVMSLTHIEKGGTYTQNFNLPFVNYAYARLSANDYIRCAAVAIGADVLWALGGSSAASWGILAMKKAFKAVAMRMLVPIGVAISVVSFGVCITEAYY